MINKTLRILSIILICSGSFNIAEESLSAYTNRGIGIILLTAGLISAGFLLTTDIVQRTNHRIKLDQVRLVDYLAVSLWVLAIILAFNESFVNRSIHEILDIKRNLLIFEIVNWLIIAIFLIAIGVLTICLFMFNRAKDRHYSLKLVIPIICCALIIPSVLTPIDSFSAGCPMKRIRLSVLNGGQQKLEELRKETQEKRERSKALHPDLTEGCSGEPLYQLYIV